MGNAFWFEWEPKFMVFLQSTVTPFFQKIWEAVTFFGDVYAMILLIGFLYWGYKKELGKRMGLYAIAALLISIDLNCLVKRRRPYFDHEDIRCLKPRSGDGDPYDVVIQGYSFPSGHATNCVSTYVVLGHDSEKKAVKTVCYVLPLLIAVSRVVLGVHYPTDILAGWLISGLVVLAVSRIRNRNAVYALIALVGIAGCFFCRSNDYFSALGIAIGFITGFSFEEKNVQFRNTGSVLRMLLRTIGGLALFVVLDKALELPFSADFLSAATMPAFLVRAARYAIVTFVAMGVYPLCFDLAGRRKKALPGETNGG